MKGFGIRAHADLREDKRPAWKFNAWEMRGIPLRIEIGPKVTFLIQILKKPLNFKLSSLIFLWHIFW